MIPKIIHQIAPKNTDQWHFIWDKCWPSWKSKFPLHEHILWNDVDDINNLVREMFPQYWDIYQQFPFHIMKIDFAKLCILYKYGGIYTDMDVYCFKNFESLLTHPLCLLEYHDAERITTNDNTSINDIENSIIVSEKENPFIKICIEKIVDKFLYAKKSIWKKDIINFCFFGSTEEQLNARLIEEITGSYLIKEAYDDYDKKNNIKILDKNLFVNTKNFNVSYSIKTIHFHTAVWGMENILFLEKNGIIDSSLTIKEKLKEYFLLGQKDKNKFINSIDFVIDLLEKNNV